jgi:hypothetical protein
MYDERGQLIMIGLFILKIVATIAVIINMLFTIGYESMGPSRSPIGQWILFFWIPNIIIIVAIWK